jgi:hypothetical protein
MGQLLQYLAKPPQIDLKRISAEHLGVLWDLTRPISGVPPMRSITPG